MTPAERAFDQRDAYVASMEALEMEGEELNLIASARVREATEMFLKAMADNIAESEKAPILEDMAVSTVADVLPHATKGSVREALHAFGGQREARGNATA